MIATPFFPMLPMKARSPKCIGSMSAVNGYMRMSTLALELVNIGSEA